MNHKITPLTESGLLAALTVIMALMAVYLPVIGMAAALLWAVPIILLVVRQGLRWGVMAVLVAAILMALVIEPMLSLRMTISFAPTGLMLGYGFRKGWSAARVFAASLGASFLAKVAALALVFALTSVNPLAFQMEGMQAAFEETFALYESLGVDQAAIDEAKGHLSEAITLVGLLMPLVLAITALVDALVNFVVAGRVLRRLGGTVPQFPPFREWRLSQAFLYLMGFSLVGLYWGGTREIELLYQASLNADMLALMAGLVQGFSLLAYVGHRYHVSLLLRGILVFLVFSSGFLIQLVAFTGLFDMAFDYRRRFGGGRWR